MLHALICQSKLIGIYSDHAQCKQTLEGLVQNRFVTRNNINIKSYYENSITSKHYDVECGHDINTKTRFVKTDVSENDTTMSESELDTDTRKKLEDAQKKKSELQYELNKIKKEHERLEESHRIFDVDVGLYYEFKKILTKKPDFEIPELFQDKYPFMERLDHDNMLNWDNFHKYYKCHPIETGYTNMFNSMPVNVPFNNINNNIKTEKEVLNDLHNNMSDKETDTDETDIED